MLQEQLRFLTNASILNHLKNEESIPDSLTFSIARINVFPNKIDWQLITGLTGTVECHPMNVVKGNYIRVANGWTRV